MWRKGKEDKAGSKHEAEINDESNIGRESPDDEIRDGSPCQGM